MKTVAGFAITLVVVAIVFAGACCLLLDRLLGSPIVGAVDDCQTDRYYR